MFGIILGVIIGIVYLLLAYSLMVVSSRNSRLEENNLKQNKKESK